MYNLLQAETIFVGLLKVYGALNIVNISRLLTLNDKQNENRVDINLTNMYRCIKYRLLPYLVGEEDD